MHNVLYIMSMITIYQSEIITITQTRFMNNIYNFYFQCLDMKLMYKHNRLSSHKIIAIFDVNSFYLFMLKYEINLTSYNCIKRICL